MELEEHIPNLVLALIHVFLGNEGTFQYHSLWHLPFQAPLLDFPKGEIQ
jgi:hypothetical protein